MNEKLGIADKIGSAINELDIDFSSFTLVGWFVNLLSLGTSGGVAYFACSALIRRNGLNLGVGMTFFLIIIGVTTSVFLTLRWLLDKAGFALTHPTDLIGDSEDASRETLNRMANSGMDMSAVHAIDFWYRFTAKENAEDMQRKAREHAFSVVAIEPNDELGEYDVLVQVQLVPNLDAIGQTEKSLGAIAAQCNGQADGWGVRQSS
ncbi:ribonuclease E inhibitor RraB [Aureliella helgolandensis]|nr:ribonuclease E inhibitor RraB [Aureliella helgolandensis]